MQGTVPAPLKCAVQMDTLGRDCYKCNTGLYWYRDSCAVPPLGMIDDIAGIAECKDDSIVLNAIVNAKIESKKLQFNLTKCVNMHIGPNKENCQHLRIHETQMLRTDTQKYLGDLISSSGNCDENIKDRCKTGFKAISQMKSLVREVSLGRISIQVGLIMRNSIFVSKMLLNSEVWHSVSKKQIEQLEVIDRIVLRNTLGAHSKTGLEWIYTDTGKFNLRALIQTRRLMYLWHLLSQDESELIRRIYDTQKISNSPGDLVRLIEADKKELEIKLSDEEIQCFLKEVFKRYVKSKVKINYLNYLNNLKKSHTKSRYLICTEMKQADYIEDSSLNTNEKQLLFRLRSQTLEVKQNFKGLNKNPWCISCGLFQETQGHLLQCPELVKHLYYLKGKTSKLNENFVYGSLHQMKMIVKIYSDIMEIRENLQNSKLVQTTND